MLSKQYWLSLRTKDVKKSAKVDLDAENKQAVSKKKVSGLGERKALQNVQNVDNHSRDKLPSKKSTANPMVALRNKKEAITDLLVKKPKQGIEVPKEVIQKKDSTKQPIEFRSQRSRPLRHDDLLKVSANIDPKSKKVQLSLPSATTKPAEIVQITKPTDEQTKDFSKEISRAKKVQPIVISDIKDEETEEEEEYDGEELGYEEVFILSDAESEVSEESLEEEQDQDFQKASEEEREILEIDIEDVQDPNLVAEYIRDIVTFFLTKEKLSRPNAKYFTTVQRGIVTPEIRGVLINFITEAQVRFSLSSETHFLAVHLLDRFLSNRIVTRPRLQLVAIAAVFIASKYEEIVPCSVDDLLWISQDIYTREELVRMEGIILHTLDFDLTCPSPLQFLKRLVKVAVFSDKMTQASPRTKADELFIKQQYLLSKYVLELSLCDAEMLQYLPSELAATALFITRQMLLRRKLEAAHLKLTASTQYQPKPIDKNIVWGEELIEHSTYSTECIRSCILRLNHVVQVAFEVAASPNKEEATLEASEGLVTVKLLESGETSKTSLPTGESMKMIKAKYSHPTFLSVALIPPVLLTSDDL